MNRHSHTSKTIRDVPNDSVPYLDHPICSRSISATAYASGPSRSVPAGLARSSSTSRSQRGARSGSAPGKGGLQQSMKEEVSAAQNYKHLPDVGRHTCLK